ncbi:MAG: S8 family serine peptidase [Acidimicrobiales bacterium]
MFAPLSAGAAAEQPVPLAVLFDAEVVEARESLAEAEAKGAKIMAEAQAKADKELESAEKKYAEAVVKIDRELAKAAKKGDKDLAKAQAEADKDLAKADKNLAKAKAEADKHLAEAQAKADKELTKTLDKIEAAIDEVQQRMVGDPKVIEAQEGLVEAEAKAAKIMAEAQAKADKDPEKAAKIMAEAQAKADKELDKAQHELDDVLAKAEENESKLAEKLAEVCSSSYGYDAERTVGSMDNISKFIGADEAWEQGYTGAGIDIAVIDTGTVPVQGLEGDKVIYGPDFSLESHHADAYQLDTYGHGTHMAGIIAGNDYDTEVEALTLGEFQGVAPDARIVSVKVADATGAVDPSQVIAAIDWVIAHRNDNGMNIRVINLSYSAASDQPYTIDPLARAVENAWDAGIVVVAAAGNDGNKTDQLSNPGYDPYVIAVSAILDDEAGKKDNCLQDKTKWKTTDYGNQADKEQRQPDLYAPGSTVVSLRNPGSFVDQAYPNSALDDRFTKATGTSQSTAVVSGAVALLLDARPELTPDQVKAILIASADDDHKVPVVDIDEAIEETIPANAKQNWQRSTGLGSLEATRGGTHVLVNGHQLTGENTVFGPWEPQQWVDSTTAGSSWTGSSWTGSSWTGSSWTGSSWTGSSWTGSSWTGSSWTGSSWTGSSWTGSSWTGSSWTGSSWTGSSWSGSSWTGAGWD